VDKTHSVIVRVPASTANLGPGFDCLGLALDIWNEIEFSLSGDSLQINIEGEGSGSLPRDESNLIFQSMKTLANNFSIPLPEGIHLTSKNKIPVASGLGSSSAAVIAGLLGAKALFDLQINDNDLLKIGLSFEGHADNISACLFGGLSIAVISNAELIVKKMEISPLKVLIVLPAFGISTHQARAILPASFSMEDTKYNIGRTALLINAFHENDFEFMEIAMRDRLHQPYRFKIIPGTESVIETAFNNGAFGAALSGAGPAVIAFFEEGKTKIGEAMLKAFNTEGLKARLFSTVTTNQGAQVSVK
jgi:homoserine kinase